MSLSFETTNKTASIRGFNLVELQMALVISCVVLLTCYQIMATSVNSMVNLDRKSRVNSSLRAAMDQVETAVMNSNFINVACSTEIMFVADLNTDPAYSFNGDVDLDGVINAEDPDADSDAGTVVLNVADQWKVGYNLKDDDDDKDNKLDVRWRIYLKPVTGTPRYSLCRDYSKNQEAWGQHIETLLTNVISTSVFRYYASRNEKLPNGNPIEDGNGDGLVTEPEIDAPVSGGPNRVGDGNNTINTLAEKNTIASVGVSLNIDINGDGTEDGALATDLLPPGLALKRLP